MSTKDVSVKKDTTKMKPRPTSAGRPPSKGGNSKHHHEDFAKENASLKEQVLSQQTDNKELKEKLRLLTLQIMVTGKIYSMEIDFDPNSDVIEVPTTELLAVIAECNRSGTKLYSLKSSGFDENRLEELETRVTLLNTELAKLCKLKLKVEGGLVDMDACNYLQEMKEKAKALWLESRNTEIFFTSKAEEAHAPAISVMPEISTTPSSTATSNNLPQAIKLNLEPVHVTTPPEKLPADTHINAMSRALVQTIVQELSLYKASGTDWRMFAERVGIPDQLVTQWQVMKLPQPMKNVLFVWGDSPGATVRMLHRHLISPLMKRVVLAKKISNFYEVD